jgi:arylsulfatase A-like enzyme
MASMLLAYLFSQSVFVASASQIAKVNATRGVKKPHIVYILADDLGFNGIGYLNSEIRTPRMDRLAHTGVKLHSFYTYCWCAPSRFALLTGRDAWKSEAGANFFEADLPTGTSLDYTLLPASLKTVGYSTHMIGKWHQGFHKKEFLPVNRGFDTFFGIVGESTDHMTQEIVHDKRLPCAAKKGERKFVDMMEGSSAAPHVLKAHEFGDTRFRKRAVELIRNHDRSRPFFLYLALQLPHYPNQVPDEYIKPYGTSKNEKNVYHGMISHVDDTVGHVVDALTAAQMYDNSVIIFSGDNGAPAEKTHAPFNGNKPLRGHKGQLYEGGIRVPAFVSGGYLPKSAHGLSLGGIMSLTDWFATLAHVTGMKVPQTGPFASDSIDNWRYITGQDKKSARNEIMMHHSPNTRIRSSLRRGDYKMFFEDGSKPILTNLAEDLTENKDVSSENPELAREMFNTILQSRCVALSMPWFSVEVEPRSEWGNQICRAWSNSGGFLGPWSEHEEGYTFFKKTKVGLEKLSRCGERLGHSNRASLNVSTR